MNASEIFKVDVKEVDIYRLNEHLHVLGILTKNPVISPIFLMDKETGAVHEECLADGDWYVTHGCHGGLFSMGYYHENAAGHYRYHLSEYFSEEDVPYRIFVPVNQELPIFNRKREIVV